MPIDEELLFYFQNVRGLRSKVDEFYSAVNSNEYDVVSVVETWLSDDVSSAEYFPTAYTVLRCDRNFAETGLSKGGGALLAVKSEFFSEPVNLSYILDNLPLVDIVGCKCLINNFFILFIYVIYIPPSISVEHFELFLNLLEQIISTNGNILILGDFNIPSFNNNIFDTKRQLMHAFLEFTNTTQFNNIVNINGRLLDLVLSDLKTCTVSRDISPLVKEDVHHPALCINVLPKIINSAKFPVNSRENNNYNFRKANYPALYDSLLQTDWTFLDDFNDANKACDEFYEKLYSIFDVHVPKYKNTKRKKFPVWYTTEIIKNIKERDHYRKNYKKYNDINSLEEYKRVRTMINLQVKEAYNNYLENVENALTVDPKHFWSYINNKKGTTTIPGKMYTSGNEIENPQNIVDHFSQFFRSVYLPLSDTIPAPDIVSNLPCINIDQLSESDIKIAIKRLKNKMTSGHDQIPSFLIKDCVNVFTVPLLTLFNIALRTSTFPECWKLAKVCPIYKCGNRADIGNYRGISILPNFAKVFEAAVYATIYSGVKNSISNHQHGFMEKRSTSTNLACLTQFITESLDNRGQVDVVYTDFSKAFDRIDHNLLIEKLNHFGFNKLLLNFFKSYLEDRLQYVQYNGFKSSTYLATSGVPQGSNLGPLLFNLFINDLCMELECEKLLFADDLKIYCNINNFEDCIALQQQLHKVEVWCTANKLEMNVSKCKVISYTRKMNSIEFSYTFNNTELIRSQTTKDLGILFDSKLDFIEHINASTNSALKSLGFIIRNCKKFSNVEALKTLYYSLVRSKLEYGAIIWDPIYNIHSQSLEKIQRKFLKYLVFKTDNYYPERGYPNTLLLTSLNMKSLENRRRVIVLVFLYKLIHNLMDCPELLSKINFRIPRLEARQNLLFYCPTNRTNILKKSPVYSMMELYNTLGEQVDIFNSSLNQYIRKISTVY